MTVVCHCCLRYEINNTNALSCCVVFAIVMTWACFFLFGLYGLQPRFLYVAFDDLCSFYLSFIRVCAAFVFIGCWFCMFCFSYSIHVWMDVFQLWSPRSLLILSLPCFAD